MTAMPWAPGDVKIATVNGQRMLVFRGRGIFAENWYTPGPVAGSRTFVSESWLLDAHPVIVIDPEDRETLERFAAWTADGDYAEWRIEWAQNFLRSLAAPPRISEPGTWGVVEAACVHERERRQQWVHHPDGNWWPVYDHDQAPKRAPLPDDWDSLIDPVLVRDGV